MSKTFPFSVFFSLCVLYVFTYIYSLVHFCSSVLAYFTFCPFSWPGFYTLSIHVMLRFFCTCHSVGFYCLSPTFSSRVTIYVHLWAEYINSLLVDVFFLEKNLIQSREKNINFLGEKVLSTVLVVSYTQHYCVLKLKATKKEKETEFQVDDCDEEQ